MGKHQDFIRRVEEYADAVGSTPESVCRAVTNNPRFWPRFKARVNAIENDVEKIRLHMRQNPAPRRSEDAA